MKMSTASFRLLALIFCMFPIFASTSAQADERAATEKGLSIFKQVPLQESNWKLIVNETLGFSFRIPASSEIDSHRQDVGFEYLGIAGHHLIKSDAYFLEIFLVPQARATTQRGWEPCPGRLLKPSFTTRRQIGIYSGELEDESGDTPGWWWRGLCTDTRLLHIWMQGAEKHDTTPILKEIYGSFRFTKNPKQESKRLRRE